jgi:hypothetical protein
VTEISKKLETLRLVNLHKTTIRVDESHPSIDKDRLWIFPVPRHIGFEGVVVENFVTCDCHYEMACASPKSPIVTFHEAAVGFRYHPYWEEGIEGMQIVDRAVRRTAVLNHEFEVSIGLPQQAIDSGSKMRHTILNWQCK